MAEWYLKDGVFGPHDSPAPPDDVVRTTAQALSESRKAQVRQNIGVTEGGTGGGSSDAVLITAQSLTAPQQAQATTNISAATVAALASHTQAAITISDSTAAGRALLTAATAAAQRTALALATVATTGAYSDLTGAPAAGGSPGGSSGQIQYNNAGAFGGDAGLAFNATTKALTIAGQFLPSIGYSPSAPAYSSAGSPTSGMTFSSGGAYFSSAGASILSFSLNGFILRGSMTLGFTSGNADAAGNDVAFSRLSANKVGLGNGTAADVSGDLALGGVSYTPEPVGTLPTPTAGRVRFANDLTVATKDTVAVGGGSNKRLVQADGTNWVIV